MKNVINYTALPHRTHRDILNALYPKETQKKQVKEITFQVTEDCCMACTYCYQNNKSNKVMTFETAKIFIDGLLNDKYSNINKDNTFGIVVDFIGGEPLMEIELIEQIVTYLYTQMIEKQHPWLFYTRINIGSNGILYNTPEVQKYFNKYGYFTSFTVSIDGNKELHDSCRIDLNGEGTYDRAMAAVYSYREKYGINPATKMTIAPENVSYLAEAVISLVNEQYTEIILNCVYENVWNEKYATILYNQLKILADYIIENNLYNKIYIRLFDEELYSPMQENDNDNWCGGVGDLSVAVNYEGNLYPCVRYMEHSLNNKQKPIITGNIYDGYECSECCKCNIEKITGITRRSQSTDECFYCPIAKGCGWCSAYNYEEFGTVNKRATYICPMHKATSLANVYYWNKLYEYLNLDKKFKMYIPEQWALQIIDSIEYDSLKKLSTKEINHGK